jgi:microcystin-dependent protein
MEELIGVIKLFGGNFAPKGCLTCDGQLLPISQYTALFSILGTTYGGDGKTNFALPKIAPLNDAIYIICVEGIYPSRN